jgi:hypothetical protein
MQKNKIATIILILVSGCISMQTHSGHPMNTFLWLTGSWKMQTNSGVLYETWKMTNDSTLSGISFRVQPDRDTVVEETATLVFRNRAYYFIPVTAFQNQQQPVTFSITTHTDGTFTSENPRHDFPQRIRYTFSKPGTLKVTIDGSINGAARSREFIFTRDSTITK